MPLARDAFFGLMQIKLAHGARREYELAARLLLMHRD
jgi:hypothetical protein